MSASVLSGRGLRKLEAKLAEFQTHKRKRWQITVGIILVGIILCVVTLPIFGTEFYEPTGCTGLFCNKHETSISYLFLVGAFIVALFYNLQTTLFGQTPRDVKFQCQGCGNEISLTRQWGCGFCFSKNNEETVVPNWVKKTYTPLSGCCSTACGKQQLAMRCPSCQHDHVLDVSGYQSQDSGNTNEGVAKMSPNLMGLVFNLAETFAPGSAKKFGDGLAEEFGEEVRHKTEVFKESQKTRRRNEMNEAKGGMQDNTPETEDGADWVKEAFDKAGFGQKNPRQ